jgi:hypothetical protein
MDLPTTFASPITESIGGVKIVFPLLAVKDLAVLASDIRADQLAAVERQLDETERITRAKNPESPGISAAERYRARMEIEAMEFSTYTIVDRIKTLAGGRRVLELSLQKAMNFAAMSTDAKAAATEEISQTLDELDLIETANLALRVSRVVKPKKPTTTPQNPEVRPLELPPDQKSGTGSATPQHSAPPDGSPGV